MRPHVSEFPVGRPNLKTIRVLILSCILASLFAAAGAQESTPKQQSPKQQPAAKTSESTALPDETTLTFPDDGTTVRPAPAATTSFTFWDFARMVLILGAVIGCIYGFFYLLRRMSGQRIEGSSLIRVIGSQSLSGNKTVHLVRVGTAVYLVGASDSSVNLISEITDKETLDELALAGSGEEGAGKKSFAELLQSMFFRGAQKPPAAGMPDLSMTDSADYIKRQQERLKKIRPS